MNHGAEHYEICEEHRTNIPRYSSPRMPDNAELKLFASLIIVARRPTLGSQSPVVVNIRVRGSCPTQHLIRTRGFPCLRVYLSVYSRDLHRALPILQRLPVRTQAILTSPYIVPTLWVQLEGTWKCTNSRSLAFSGFGEADPFTYTSGHILLRVTDDKQCLFLRQSNQYC